MKTKLPKQLIVTLENEGDKDNEFFNGHKTAEEAVEHGVRKRGGIYVLKELITIESVTKVSPGE